MCTSPKGRIYKKKIGKFIVVSYEGDIQHPCFKCVTSLSNLSPKSDLNDSILGWFRTLSLFCVWTTVQDLASGLDNSQQIDAILFDFSKAFDKVPHQMPLIKLEHYGVKGKALQWIRSFLSDRTQKAVVEDKSSSSARHLRRAPCCSSRSLTTCHPKSTPMPDFSQMIVCCTATRRRVRMQSL